MPVKVSTISILDTDYQIRRPKQSECANEKAMGWCQNEPPAHIAVQAELTGSAEASTFLHEIMHGIMCATRGVTVPMDPARVEEHFVTILSAGLMTVFKQNPRLVTFIAERL